jgi:predicted DNA-binding protein with PD1-like motif
MRQIRQPGPITPERVQWVEARGRAFSLRMESGVPLLDAAQRGFEAEGFAGGVVNIRAGALGRFAYVMPALAKSDAHAAFYSDTFRPQGITRLETGTMTFGKRDGAPFFHCHALWMEADGRPGGGHILPEETVVAEAFDVDAFGLDGAMFAAEPDPETNFKLFGPVTSGMTHAQTSCRAFALRLRPNQDVAHVLENFCRERGITRARLHGGVGSTIGARFTDGRSVQAFATELTVTSGMIAPGASGGIEAQLDVALVDYTGGLAEGRLVRSDNPVLMTMELVLQVIS